MEVQVIEARTSDLGDGFIVRRSLPSGQKRMVGPFIFWDHMGPVKITPDFEMKVRAHPHIGLATLTYLFSGEIMHRDNLGYEQLIRPGEINWMTAGRGIAHSERSNGNQKYEDLEGIQLWIALPKHKELIDPDFQHVKATELPKLDINGCRLTLIAGEFSNAVSPVKVHSPLFYLHGELKAGDKLKFDLPADSEGAIYLTKGTIKLNGNAYCTHQLIVFTLGAPIDVEVSDDCNIMIFGGEPFPEGRHIWWNFVASEPQLIENAKKDWLAGKYNPVINEKEYIPLPEN